jgi:hypothetical protein
MIENQQKTRQVATNTRNTTVFVGGIGPFPDDSTWCGAYEESSNTMKPYYLKNAGEYHSRLTTKLAVLLLALPVLGAFAADPTDTLTYNGTGANTFANTNGALSFKDGTSNIFTVATSSGALTDSNLGAAAQLTFGMTVTSDVPTTSTYNNVGPVAATPGALLISNKSSITVNNGLNLTATTVTLGAGNYTAWGTGSSTGSISLTFAGYSTSGSNVFCTSLTTSDLVTVGSYGDSNSLTVKDGAKASTVGLKIGARGAEDQTTYIGDKNTVKVSSSATVSGATLAQVAMSNWNANAGAITVGDFGAENKLIVEKGAYFQGTGAVTVGSASVSSSNGIEVTSGPSASITDNGGYAFKGGALMVGSKGSTNYVAISGGAKASVGAVVVGSDSSAASNFIGLNASTLESSGTAQVGVKGSSNYATLAAGSVLSLADDLIVGLGDASADTANGKFEPTYGGSNYITLDGVSGIKVGGGDILVGSAGKSNYITVSGASVIAAAYGLKDGALDNATGLTNAVIGFGMAKSSKVDVSAAGNSNTVTVTGSKSALAAANVKVGVEGSSNKLVVSEGAYLVGSVTAGSKFDGDVLTLKIGDGSTNSVLSAADDTVFAKGNSVEITAASALVNEITIGNFGSHNSLVVSKGASVKDVNSIILGFQGATSNPDSPLSTTVKYSRANSMTITGEGSSVITNDGAVVVVGVNGGLNTLSVADGAILWIKKGFISIGNAIVSNCGYGNVVTVDGSNSILSANDLQVGSNNSSQNKMVVSNGGLVLLNNVSSTYGDAATILVDGNGDSNAIQINGGYVAIKGKLGEANYNGNIDNLYEEIFGDTVTSTTGTTTHTDGLIDVSGIEVWNGSKFVTATASDISVKYCSSEADAKAITGYTGLAGYTIISQKAGAAVRDLTWAGSNLYDNKDGWYCSTWYGWFYSTEASGNFIMSSTADSWQYVAPGSTPASTYFYDYKLGSWIFTDSTHFQKNWVYEYATSSWIQLGK